MSDLKLKHILENAATLPARADYAKLDAGGRKTFKGTLGDLIDMGRKAGKEVMWLIPSEPMEVVYVAAADWKALSDINSPVIGQCHFVDLRKDQPVPMMR